MSGDPSHWGERPAGAVDSPLNEALDDLEQILDPRREPSSAGEVPDVSEAAFPTPVADDTPGESGEGGDLGGPAYSIPLLEDVVLPGNVVNEPATTPDDISPGPDPVTAAADDHHYQDRVARRLASEIEIIVDTQIEAAMRQASEEIRRQVTAHIQIVLPELLEDLALAPPKNADAPDL